MKHRTDFSFVPTFPLGTMPMAIATVIGHMSARVPLMQMRSLISEREARNAYHPYGFNARKIAENLFGTAMTPSRYLREHTLFGFLEHIVGNDAMTEDDEHFLCEGERCFIAVKRSFRSLLKLNSYLSWCPTCCQEDQARYGFAAWKVMHQFPFVQHCLIHQEPLLYKCDDCDRIDNSGRDLRLPQIACRFCGSRSFFRPSSQRCEAYWRLIGRLALLRDKSKKTVNLLTRLNQSLICLGEQLGNDKLNNEIKKLLEEEWRNDRLYSEIQHNPLTSQRPTSVVFGTLAWLDAVEILEQQ